MKRTRRHCDGKVPGEEISSRYRNIHDEGKEKYGGCNEGGNRRLRSTRKKVTTMPAGYYNKKEEGDSDSDPDMKVIVKKRKILSEKTVNRKAHILKKKSKSEKKESNEEAEYEVDKILDFRLKRNGEREFLIRWMNFSEEHDSWEPESNLDCNDLIQEYFDKNEMLLIDEKEKFENNRVNLRDSLRRRGSKVTKNVEHTSSDLTSPSRRMDYFAETDIRINSCSDNKNIPNGNKGKTNISMKNGKKNITLSRSTKKSRRKEEDCANGTKNGTHENSKQDKEADLNIDISEKRTEEDLTEYEVERIVDVRYFTDGSRDFLIKWKGFSVKNNSWEPEDYLNCKAVLKQFLEENEADIKPRELRFESKKPERFMLDDRRRRLSRRLKRLPRKSYFDMD